jgi:hypothetical protein
VTSLVLQQYLQVTSVDRKAKLHIDMAGFEQWPIKAE